MCYGPTCPLVAQYHGLSSLEGGLVRVLIAFVLLLPLLSWANEIQKYKHHKTDISNQRFRFGSVSVIRIVFKDLLDPDPSA